MVIKGSFKVQLVEAESEQPFKEHKGEDGEYYAEVEPGAEYFVQIQHLNGASSDFCFVADLEVDGVDLGYEQRITDGTAHMCGGWKYRNGTSVETSLRFEKPRLALPSPAASQLTAGQPPLMMGKVTVSFWKAKFSHKKKRRVLRKSKSIVSGSLGGTSEGISGKALVRSGEGSLLRTYKESRCDAVYKRDKTIHEKITLHYCTMLGLVEARILRPGKAFWECARLRFPPKRQPPEPWLQSLKPKRHTREAIIKDGVLLEPSKQWDVYDLTAAGIDSDDDQM